MLDEIVISRAIIDRYFRKLMDNLEVDVAIAGGGPAGLTAGYFLAKEGVKVALAPLITDLPIILLSLLMLTRLANFHRVVGLISFVGGLYVLYLAYECSRSDAVALEAPDDKPKSVRKGVLINALNPHPYLFWATVGGPALVSGWRESPLHALGFLVPFYALLVGSKATIAWLVSRQAGGLSQLWYRRTLQGSGVLLLAMGIWLIWQAWAG